MWKHSTVLLFRQTTSAHNRKDMPFKRIHYTTISGKIATKFKWLFGRYHHAIGGTTVRSRVKLRYLFFKSQSASMWLLLWERTDTVPILNKSSTFLYIANSFLVGKSDPFDVRSIETSWLSVRCDLRSRGAAYMTTSCVLKSEQTWRHASWNLSKNWKNEHDCSFFQIGRTT